MEIHLHCSECDGDIVFRSTAAPSRGGRLTGRCEACTSVFSLYGGRLSAIELAPVLKQTRWPFSLSRG